MEKLEERMVELLLSKAKMLKFHCPKCMSPLFEKEGKIICPACGVFSKEGVKRAEEERPKIEKKSNKIIRKKRDELLKRLEKETEPDKIVKLTETIKKLDRLLGAEQDEGQ